MIGRNKNGTFIKGRKETQHEKELRAASLKESWKNRDGYHGYYGTKIYNTWRSMKNRCDGTSSEVCNNKYHKKGITYSTEWADFNVFLADMLPTYVEGYQLDRIDNNNGYSKDNCRWVTSKENNNNRRNNVRIEYNGQTKTLSQWADFFGIKFSTIRVRYYQSYLKGKIDKNKLFKTP